MRTSGVLMHIASLPSPYGIGTMGQEAYKFADFLKKSGQGYWQMLPICPTSYGDSPYQSFSTFAGNPYFIDFDMLVEEGLLERDDYENRDWYTQEDRIDYGKIYENRFEVLKIAANRLLSVISAEYTQFCQDNVWWLDDFAMFMTLKNINNGAAWWLWDEDIRARKPEAMKQISKSYASDIYFWKVTQYLFFKQWNKLKAYVNEQNVKIIGDLPIYVSHDSVDVWAHPELFQLDENMMPREIAGCPPDGFSATGQLWGNPLFDWDYMEKDDYAWWIKRIEYCCHVYDVLRIDHFRGFDSYFAIPYGATTAAGGQWKKGPGMKLFRAVERHIGKQPIIAEDLGYLTESVRQLLADSTFPGMKVLELAFDSRDTNGNVYLPHNFVKDCIAYAGTHDNDTILGWMTSADEVDTNWAKDYLHLTEEEGYNWGMMRSLWATVADTVIVQAQDLLGLGSEARMNQPSTVGRNWQWRAKSGVFTEELAERLYAMMKMYERIPQKVDETPKVRLIDENDSPAEVFNILKSYGSILADPEYLEEKENQERSQEEAEYAQLEDMARAMLVMNQREKHKKEEPKVQLINEDDSPEEVFNKLKSYGSILADSEYLEEKEEQELSREEAENAQLEDMARAMLVMNQREKK